MVEKGVVGLSVHVNVLGANRLFAQIGSRVYVAAQVC